MTRRGGLFLAGGLLVSVLGPACGPTDKEPVVKVAAAEPLIHDGAGLPEGTNATTTVTITVLDELEKKGTGVVRVTTKVGMFGAEGNNTLVTLSDGTATLDFTCPVAKDPTCALGVASISADWRGNLGRGKVYVGEKGKQLMGGSTGSSGPPPISGGDPTATGTFDVFTTSQPYFLGSLNTSLSGFRAASPVTQPLRSFVGIPSSLTYVELRSDGKLVYKSDEESTARLYLAMGDAFTTDDTSTKTFYPASPMANDQLIPTTKCGPSGVGNFQTHPTLPEVYYSCAGVGASPYYNEAGVQVVPSTYFIKRVGYNGYKLVVDYASGGTTLYLLDANNTPRMVSLPSNPNTRYMLALASRAKSNGFDMIYYNPGDALQLWHLSFAGAWSRLGVYPMKLPTGYAIATDYNWVLDGQGNAYGEVSSAQGDGIARYSLGAAEATILYKVSNRPADSGWEQWPPKLYNVLDRSVLFTGP
jgi:hypothetical protein